MKASIVLPARAGIDFEALVRTIAQTHRRMAGEAAKAVNVRLTLRNWLIGFYIREYELGGRDRAVYGDRLLEKLAQRLDAQGVQRADERELRRYRQFYLTYPQIRESLPPEFAVPPRGAAGGVIRETLSPELQTPAAQVIEGLSFSHLVELVEIADPAKRAFYESESLRGNWSVRELRRQVASLYYERSSLSKDKQKLADVAESKAGHASSPLTIRDPYVFEFLGLKPAEVMSESRLEELLLGKLQQFLLELGKGFCFEARQKRILIGGEHFFVDLVFYHRILRCHVLIELKLDGFAHEYLGQLNTYVNWFRKNETIAGDNPPIGLLLCTQKNHALVEYALAGMDNRLFVSKYELQLPEKDEIRRFLEEEIDSNQAKDLVGGRDAGKFEAGHQTAKEQRRG
ncbi:MAG TPA: PDDEXK nuclease domain-containing protein [Planctomycetota bacterium]